MNTLTYLQAAVQAKHAYWFASRELETHLGYDDVPDAVEKVLQDYISHLAVSLPVNGESLLTEIDVDELGRILADLADTRVTGLNPNFAAPYGASQGPK